jgi:hypothetical protein
METLTYYGTPPQKYYVIAPNGIYSEHIDLAEAEKSAKDLAMNFANLSTLNVIIATHLAEIVVKR